MRKSIFSSFTALICLAACQTVGGIDSGESNVDDTSLSANIEQNETTKTVLSEINNVHWSENDQIIAFVKSSYGHKYQIQPSFAGKTYADFLRVSSSSGNDISGVMEWDHNVAYYPYSEAIECVKSGNSYTLEVVLPAEQIYEENSFGNGSFPMLAVSEEHNLTFKNVCGGIKLQLKGTQKVKSITIQGNNKEKLSGKAVVKASTDGEKPVIIMTANASTSVVLNCGAGIQLNDEDSTVFIIALPPVNFPNGFTVTVADENDKTYVLQTDMDNLVGRSYLQVMPTVKLDDSNYDDELIIPVDYVNMRVSSLKLCKGAIAQLEAIVGPRDATDKTVFWDSDNPEVAIINQDGMVEALNPGVANITAMSGEKSATCSVSVSNEIILIDYIDEYNENHGKGIVIGNTVWAPINCGYHKVDYQYGKLYQWGRKYGQGYSGELRDFATTEIGEIVINTIGEISDATIPIIEAGGVSKIMGSHKSKANVFFRWHGDGRLCDWVDPRDDTLWNSGTEDCPIKTEYDPCPKGWRIPTYTELFELSKNKSGLVIVNGQHGVWHSGSSLLTDKVPQIFLPATGHRENSSHKGLERGEFGRYWSSTVNYLTSDIYYLDSGYGGGGMAIGVRSNGHAVRCVQE